MYTRALSLKNPEHFVFWRKIPNQWAISRDTRVTDQLEVIQGWDIHFPNLGALSCAAGV